MAAVLELRADDVIDDDDADYKTLLTKAHQLVTQICSHFSKSCLAVVSALFLYALQSMLQLYL